MSRPIQIFVLPVLRGRALRPELATVEHRNFFPGEGSGRSGELRPSRNTSTKVRHISTGPSLLLLPPGVMIAVYA